MRRSERKCTQEVRKQSSKILVDQSKTENQRRKQQVQINNSEVIQQEFVSVKIEPEFNLDIISTNYCRCCFKLQQTFETEDLTEHHQLLDTLRDITQLNLYPSNYAPNFCYECANKIHNFNNFRMLMVARQNKFTHIIRNERFEELKELCSINVEENQVEEVKSERNESSVIITEQLNEQTENVIDETQIVKVKKIRRSVCPTCKICSSKVHHLKRHMLRCHPVNCVYCTFKARYKSEVEKHIRQKHGKCIKEEKESNECPECGKFVKRRLYDHIKNLHGKIKNYCCDLCGYRTYGRTGFMQHLLIQHFEKNLKCNECEYTAANQVILRAHWNRTHKKTSFICKICNVTFGQKTNLDNHIKRKHEPLELLEKFACDLCDFETYDKNYIKHHKLTKHSMKRDHICEKCGKGFATNKILKAHMLHIHEEKQFSCDKCGKKYVIKSLLQNHIERVHIRLKRYVCDACGKGFADIRRLLAHKMDHTGIRFPCFIPGCQSNFSRKDASMFHLKHSHSLTTLEENECIKKINEFCANLKKNLK
ncbi:CLUMA_CG007924, isoform A [Clunio marinus]|uniref:CLUMA_CG007924, isoform A n=1 Tax=Clunio marinus TaxID=568069 RepID=A0A1J1I7N0_9DIPT|nr:CLUMA_CG007924, isoform A [Clunio marinus]